MSFEKIRDKLDGGSFMFRGETIGSPALPSDEPSSRRVEGLQNSDALGLPRLTTLQGIHAHIKRYIFKDSGLFPGFFR